MRELIRERLYAVSAHAIDEIEDDGLTVFDIESIILSGEIIERQRDRVSREQKYVIRGPTLDGTAACAVTKFDPSGWLLVITVYAE